MDDNNYHYLEDIIFNKGRQIVCVEKKYMNMQTKSGHLSKLLGALVFIPSLFLIANVHYILFLNFGLPSLFITPASAMVLALLTGIGAKIGERIYAGKIGKCEEMIQRLKEEKDKYQKQLEKVRKRQLNKQDIEKQEVFPTKEIMPITSFEESSEAIQEKGSPKIMVKSARRRN